MTPKLGELLRKARHRRGVTLRTLAPLLGLSAQSLHSIEVGQRLPPPLKSAFYALAADELTLPLDELLAMARNERDVLITGESWPATSR